MVSKARLVSKDNRVPQENKVRLAHKALKVKKA
jgi:hypothetical protein